MRRRPLFIALLALVIGVAGTPMPAAAVDNIGPGGADDDTVMYGGIDDTGTAVEISGEVIGNATGRNGGNVTNPSERVVWDPRRICTPGWGEFMRPLKSDGTVRGSDPRTILTQGGLTDAGVQSVAQSWYVAIVETSLRVGDGLRRDYQNQVAGTPNGRGLAWRAASGYWGQDMGSFGVFDAPLPDLVAASLLLNAATFDRTGSTSWMNTWRSPTAQAATSIEIGSYTGAPGAPGRGSTLPITVLTPAAATYLDFDEAGQIGAVRLPTGLTFNGGTATGSYLMSTGSVTRAANWSVAPGINLVITPGTATTPGKMRASAGGSGAPAQGAYLVSWDGRSVKVSPANSSWPSAPLTQPMVPNPAYIDAVKTPNVPKTIPDPAWPYGTQPWSRSPGSSVVPSLATFTALLGNMRDSDGATYTTEVASDNLAPGRDIFSALRRYTAPFNGTTIAAAYGNLPGVGNAYADLVTNSPFKGVANWEKVGSPLEVWAHDLLTNRWEKLTAAFGSTVTGKFYDAYKIRLYTPNRTRVYTRVFNGTDGSVQSPMGLRTPATEATSVETVIANEIIKQLSAANTGAAYYLPVLAGPCLPSTLDPANPAGRPSDYIGHTIALNGSHSFDVTPRRSAAQSTYGTFEWGSCYPQGDVWYWDKASKSYKPHPVSHYAVNGKKPWGVWNGRTFLDGDARTTHYAGNGIRLPNERLTNIGQTPTLMTGGCSIYWKRFSPPAPAPIPLSFDLNSLVPPVLFEPTASTPNGEPLGQAVVGESLSLQLLRIPALVTNRETSGATLSLNGQDRSAIIRLAVRHIGISIKYGTSEVFVPRSAFWPSERRSAVAGTAGATTSEIAKVTVPIAFTKTAAARLQDPECRSIATNADLLRETCGISYAANAAGVYPVYEIAIRTWYTAGAQVAVWNTATSSWLATGPGVYGYFHPLYTAIPAEGAGKAIAPFNTAFADTTIAGVRAALVRGSCAYNPTGLATNAAGSTLGCPVSVGALSWANTPAGASTPSGVPPMLWEKASLSCVAPRGITTYDARTTCPTGLPTRRANESYAAFGTRLIAAWRNMRIAGPNGAPMWDGAKNGDSIYDLDPLNQFVGANPTFPKRYTGLKVVVLQARPAPVPTSQPAGQTGTGGLPPLLSSPTIPYSQYTPPVATYSQYTPPVATYRQYTPPVATYRQYTPPVATYRQYTQYRQYSQYSQYTPPYRQYVPPTTRCIPSGGYCLLSTDPTSGSSVGSQGHGSRWAPLPR